MALVATDGPTILVIREGVIPMLEDQPVIAAAPELLEACQTSAQNIRNGYPLDAGTILEQLEKAIARAGGGAS